MNRTILARSALSLIVLVRLAIAAETALPSESMLRFGLTEDIEFRLRWDYAWVSVDDEPSESGTGSQKVDLA